MSSKIYFINRYSSNQENVKAYSGYEHLVKYSSVFKSVKSNAFISKLIFKIFKIEKPRDYRSIKASEELKLFFKALLTGRPVFYLYADKDAYLLPLLKGKFNLQRIRIFGTLHWPAEVSGDFAFYKYNLASQFNGIISLSSSLQGGAGKRCIIPHGIDTEYWKNENPQKYENTYLILGISNRDHQGQIDTIIKIKEIDPQAKFILLMQDPQIVALYSSISEIEIIKERISDAHLKKLYSKSKAVILMQTHCLASNVVLECISMKTPLLANRVGDIEEYLGIEYPLYLNKSTAEEKLQEFCHSMKFREVAVNSLAQRRDNFTWQNIADKTVDFINSGRC